MNQVGANSHTAEKPYSYKDVARYYDFEKTIKQKLKTNLPGGEENFGMKI